MFPDIFSLFKILPSGYYQEFSFFKRFELQNYNVTFLIIYKERFLDCDVQFQYSYSQRAVQKSVKTVQKSVTIVQKSVTTEEPIKFDVGKRERKFSKQKANFAGEV